jgi:hypothetical protein
MRRRLCPEFGWDWTGFYPHRAALTMHLLAAAAGKSARGNLPLSARRPLFGCIAER